MKLVEVSEQEPFVVPMLRKLLEKGEKVLLVIVQKGGAESVMGIIQGIKTEKDRQGVPEYVLQVFTNTLQDYAYGMQRLRRADIRQRTAAGEWDEAKSAFKSRKIPALYVPASGNAEDLGGHDL